MDKKAKSYREIVKIPDELKNELPTSYDVIGDIALIKLKDNLISYKKAIADAFLRSYSNIKTVFLAQPVSGELRKRKIEFIAGKKRTVTVHKEYGLKFQLDISKVYFSPRLASERKRIADLVEDNETIIDMFAGVAPFSIMIAKYANPKIVYAFDKNRYAVKYAKMNILKNNFLDKVEVIHTDAKKIPQLLDVKADRIIMNLPFSAYQFFPTALKLIDEKCVIHYYDILEDSFIDDRIEYLTMIAEKKGFKFSNISINKIKSYTPREFYISIDITAEEK